MEFRDYLKIMVMKDGSDLYFSTGAPTCGKFEGKIKPIEKETNPPGRIAKIAMDIMDDKQKAEFEERPEMNLALSEPGIGRFRVNIFKQRNEIAMVVRNIKMDLPRWEDLGLPEVLTKVIMEKRGLLLFVGGTGSGKSTSLAALIDHRNINSAGHIITIEDPIEFVHKHKKSIINQREVGVDTLSYDDALINTLRQAPDVILIGEIRTKEVMEHALAFAETGHLCISTLHANNSNQALDRIINFFPEDKRDQLFLDLSLNLRGIVSQRLIPTIDEKRCCAVEVLLGTPTVQDTIRRRNVKGLKEIMEKSANIGMQTFDMSIFELYQAGTITAEEAVKNADSKNNMALRLKFEKSEKTEKKPAAIDIDFGELVDDSEFE